MPRSLRIAVVDDEAPVRKALARLLALSSFEVATFASGQDFLGSLPAQPPDCLVLDLHMPGLTGLEVQRELARTGIRLPTVIVTAYDEPESRIECLAAGAAAYLLKPIDSQTLRAAIAHAVGDSERLGDRGDAPG